MIVRTHHLIETMNEILVNTFSDSKKGKGYKKVKEPTRRGNILDLVFTKNSSLVQNIQVVDGLSDHSINLKTKWKGQPRRKYFVRKKANVDSINEDLDDLNKTCSSMGSPTVCIIVLVKN